MKNRSLDILLVEDQYLIRAMTAEMLEEQAHRVVQAASYDEAIAALAQQRFDLLITDLNLAGDSGIELARKAVQDDPGLALMLATGRSSVAELDGDAALARAVLLHKPWTPETLAAAVARCIGPS